MKQFSFIATLVLMATSAFGQQNPYQLKNLRGSYSDITSQTAAVNAWKYISGNPVCAPRTLRPAALTSSLWCIGSPSGNVYMFDMNDKTWHAHTEFGTPSYIVPLNEAGGNLPAVAYALMRTSLCNGMGTAGGESDGWYGVFAWNASNNTWSQPNSGACAAHLWVDYNGTLHAIGWDSPKQITAAYVSTNQGSSWTLQYDGWSYINMIKPDEGCVLDLNHAIWELSFDGNGNPAPEQFPQIPSGTAAGCVLTENPFALMAWNTSGQAYVMQDGATTWQAVTGINLQTAVGSNGYFIFGEDSSGKPYRWNTYAPGMTATYGGQWATSNGCPTPSSPCHPTITHTVNFKLNFATGHGIGGQQGSSTQVFTNDIEVNGWDYSPGCDPIFGPPADPECRISLAAEARCNQSNQDVGNFSVTYVVADSIDVMDWIGNEGSAGPVRVQTMMYQGYYTGTVTNNVKDGCFVSDPVPMCPAGLLAEIDIKTEWYGKLDAEGYAYAKELNEMARSRIGADAPYVYHSFYLAEELPDGTLVDVTCFPPQPDTPDAFLDGQYELRPHCK